MILLTLKSKDLKHSESGLKECAKFNAKLIKLINQCSQGLFFQIKLIVHNESTRPTNKAMQEKMKVSNVQ